MSEVVPADRTRLLQSKRQECSSIARSRKRKLRELFAVATAPDGVPTHSVADPDAQLTNAAEIQFLERCDVLKYVMALCSCFIIPVATASCSCVCLCT
jgi:chromatin modification-related protein VID21